MLTCPIDLDEEIVTTVIAAFINLDIRPLIAPTLSRLKYDSLTGVIRLANILAIRQRDQSVWIGHHDIGTLSSVAVLSLVFHP